MQIATKRLLLRPMVMTDAADVYEYSREANVGPNAGWKPHETLEETREIMQAVFVGQEGVFAIVRQDTGRVIGSVGIIPDPKRENTQARMLGYALSEHCWGQGIMTEAVQAVIYYGFMQLNLQVISAYCYPDNHRSQRVLQKCGFVYEGRLRQCETLYDGSVKDNLCFSILRS